MSDRHVLIEQRLQTRMLARILMLVFIAFVVITVSLFENAKASAPAWLWLIESVVILFLLTAVLAFLKIIVSVEETKSGRALVISYGPGGFLRQTFPVERIERAYAAHFTYAQMGGYGYRGSLKVIRQAALVTRRGDALDLELARRRRFIVTVDDPVAFVEALDLPT